MRHEAATKIRQIKSSVRAGDCRAARAKFNALVPLIGTRGQRTHLRPKTVARLWGLVESCRFRRS